MLPIIRSLCHILLCDLITGPRGGVPNDKIQDGATRIQNSEIPSATAALREYEACGGNLTVFNSYGIDQLKDRQDLIEERERLFRVRYPDFGVFFHSVVNGNNVLFRGGLLYLIRISNVLSKQL